MSKFVIAKKVPTTLEKGVSVISSPDFLEQIKANAHKASKNKLTGLNHMRDIINSIRQQYDESLNIFKIPFSQYQGLPYANDNDLSKIILNILKKHNPSIFEKVLEYNIKNRPYGSKLIYYTGDYGDTGVFSKQGIDMIDEKDVDEYLGLKPKKIIGKPAVTKEQSEESAS